MAPPNTSLGAGLRDVGQQHKIIGVTLAIVVTAGDSDPLGKGRVQIILPSLDSGVQSWAAVARQPGSTGNYDIGDTVIVAFEHGDISYPIVLGRI